MKDENPYKNTQYSIPISVHGVTLNRKHWLPSYQKNKNFRRRTPAGPLVRRSNHLLPPSFKSAARVCSRAVFVGTYLGSETSGVHHGGGKHNNAGATETGTTANLFHDLFFGRKIFGKPLCRMELK